MRTLKLGSCPDSWGVWFPDDPEQVPWQRFLDELARVGYEYITHEAGDRAGTERWRFRFGALNSERLMNRSVPETGDAARTQGLG